MNIIYRAFDGKEFEGENDCLYYEREITANKYKNDIIGLNEGLEEINLFNGMSDFSKEVILFL